MEAQRLSHTGSFGWSPASGTIYWSEETFASSGSSPGRRRRSSSIVQRTHPDDRAAVQGDIDAAQREGLDFEPSTACSCRTAP